MTSETSKDKSMHLITEYIKSDAPAMKRTSSMLSPPEHIQDQKKSNTEEKSTNNHIMGDPTTSTMETALAPILSEIKLLRDSQALNMNKWSGKGWLSNMLTIVRDKYQP